MRLLQISSLVFWYLRRYKYRHIFTNKVSYVSTLFTSQVRWYEVTEVERPNRRPSNPALGLSPWSNVLQVSETKRRISLVSQPQSEEQENPMQHYSQDRQQNLTLSFRTSTAWRMECHCQHLASQSSQSIKAKRICKSIRWTHARWSWFLSGHTDRRPTFLPKAKETVVFQYNLRPRSCYCPPFAAWHLHIQGSGEFTSPVARHLHGFI